LSTRERERERERERKRERKREGEQTSALRGTTVKPRPEGGIPERCEPLQQLKDRDNCFFFEKTLFISGRRSNPEDKNA